MIEINTFESDDPENPTLEDEFKMDLALTMGYKSVSDMLNHIDSNEYSFFFEKWKRACFGPSILNQQLNTLMILVHNALADKSIKDDDAFLIKVREVEDPAVKKLRIAAERYTVRLREWIKRKDLTRKDLEGQRLPDDKIKKILAGEYNDMQLENIANSLGDKYKKGLEEQWQQ